jgi:hypothetical protein
MSDKLGEDRVENADKLSTVGDHSAFDSRAEKSNLVLRLLPYAVALLLGAVLTFLFFPRLVLVPFDPVTGRVLRPEDLGPSYNPQVPSQAANPQKPRGAADPATGARP